MHMTLFISIRDHQNDGYSLQLFWTLPRCLIPPPTSALLLAPNNHSYPSGADFLAGNTQIVLGDDAILSEAASALDLDMEETADMEAGSDMEEDH